MKKVFAILALITMFTYAQAQSDVDEWKVDKLENTLDAQAKQIKDVSKVVDLQTEALELITKRQVFIDSKFDSLQYAIPKIFEVVNYVKENKEVVKTPVKTQEDANLLFGVLFGLVNLLVNAISLAYEPFRIWIERYVGKSMLALATAVIFTAVATVISKGDASILQILGYLVAILGTHFGIFTTAKKAASVTAKPQA